MLTECQENKHHQGATSEERGKAEGRGIEGQDVRKEVAKDEEGMYILHAFYRYPADGSMQREGRSKKING